MFRDIIIHAAGKISVYRACLAGLLDESSAYFCAAVAHSQSLVSMGGPTVLVGQFLILRNVSLGKYSQPRYVLNCPFFNDAVGVARMVDISCDASALAGVNARASF